MARRAGEPATALVRAAWAVLRRTGPLAHALDLADAVTGLEGLSREQRAAVVRGAFAAPSDFPGAAAGPLLLVEDVVTTGGSSLKAVHQLREAGFVVNRVITLVDREEGGAAAMAAADLELVSLFRLSEVSSCAEELS